MGPAARSIEPRPWQSVLSPDFVPRISTPSRLCKPANLIYLRCRSKHDEQLFHPCHLYLLLIWIAGERYIRGADGYRVQECVAATASTASEYHVLEIENQMRQEQGLPSRPPE